MAPQSALVTVSSLLSIISALQQTYSTIKHTPREIRELLIEVTALGEILLALSRLPIHNAMKGFDMNSGFYGSVVSCGKTLTEIQRESQEVLGSDTTKHKF